LRGQLTPQGDLLPGLACGSMVIATAAWAEAEAADPEHIRLFFMDDFFTEPEIAMKGLFQFLGKSPVAALDRVATEFSTDLFDNMTTNQDTGCLVASGPETPFGKLCEMRSAPQLVADFEMHMAAASEELREMWDSFIGMWLHSSNRRLACMAQNALARQAWAPPGWWAAHCARLCRPCLFFPRGTCREDAMCKHCHGPDHHKPKRPNKGKRSRRKGVVTNDRTPSPLPCEARAEDARTQPPVIELPPPAAASVHRSSDSEPFAAQKTGGAFVSGAMPYVPAASAVVGAVMVPQQPYLVTIATPLQVVWASKTQQL